MRDGARQAILTEPQRRQTGEVAQLGRDGTGQVVFAEFQPLQIGEAAQLGRNGARQVVSEEDQPLQVGEIAEFGRDGTRQRVPPRVPMDTKPPQIAHAAQLGRDGARQVVRTEIQYDNPTSVVNLDTVPFSERRIRQPVLVVDPVRPAGGMVQRLQDLAVGQGTALRTRALVGRDRAQPVAEGRIGRSTHLRPGVVKGPGERAPPGSGGSGPDRLMLPAILSSVIWARAPTFGGSRPASPLRLRSSIVTRPRESAVTPCRSSNAPSPDQPADSVQAVPPVTSYSNSSAATSAAVAEAFRLFVTVFD